MASLRLGNEIATNEEGVLIMSKFSVLFLALLFAILTAPVLAQRAGTNEKSEKTADRSSSRNSRNLELLPRAEERAANLRTKLLELETREVELQRQIADLEYQATPAAIQRSLAFVGSVRPMDELRDALRTRLESEKARVTRQLELLTATRQRLEATLSTAEAEIQRLQQQLSSK
jgi:chromosome segregation ATPase